VTEGEAERLTAAFGMTRELVSGALLWQAGDPGTDAAILLEGRLEVLSESEAGETIVLRVLEPGAILGEMSCLEGAPHSATVRAVGRTRLRMIPAARLRALLDASPALWTEIVRQQSERVRSLSRQLGILAFEGVLTRVARYLLEVPSPLRMTHQQIGERVAATRESVTKALGSLSRLGAVRSGRGVVEVLDRPLLESAASLSDP
jgi:CRP-like cAMP-binding protein